MRKLIIAVYVITVFIFISCSREATDETASATWVSDGELLPIAVEVFEISRGQLIPFVESSGIIRGENEATVLSETQGKILEVRTQLGKTVKKDEILMIIENDLQKLNRDLALQQYEAAELDFRSIEKSYESGGLSRSDFNSAKSRLLQSRSTYESASRAYGNTFIRAPFDGTVASLDSSLSVGNGISPAIPVAKIIDTSFLRMEIFLGERQVNLIEEGQRAEVTIPSLGEDSINAVVQAIGTGSDSVTGSFPVLLSWQNSSEQMVRSGLSAAVRIAVMEEDRQIIVPTSALVVRDRKQSVLLAEEGKVRIRRVETGPSLGGHTIITSGLKEGEQLIVSALSSLGENYPVETSLRGKTGDWR